MEKCVRRSCAMRGDLAIMTRVGRARRASVQTIVSPPCRTQLVPMRKPQLGALWLGEAKSPQRHVRPRGPHAGGNFAAARLSFPGAAAVLNASYQENALKAVRHRSSGIAVIIAALVLLLQSSLTASAIAAMPDGPALDLFGNPLCITGAGHGSPVEGDHAKLPNCCTMACASALPALHAPQGTASAFPPARSADTPLPTLHTSQDRHTRDHDPGRPRAPPLKV